jgi:hypothetical protein
MLYVLDNKAALSYTLEDAQVEVHGEPPGKPLIHLSKHAQILQGWYTLVSGLKAAQENQK